jgi:hypothetical protein
MLNTVVRRAISAGVLLVVASVVSTACSSGSDESSSAPNRDDRLTESESASPSTSRESIDPTVPPTSTPPTIPPTTTPPPPPAVMPDLMCRNLQEAQDTIQRAGVFFSRSEDATGEDRMQLVDSNWLVVDQAPAAGTPIDEGEALLYVVKYGEPNPCGL